MFANICDKYNLKNIIPRLDNDNLFFCCLVYNTMFAICHLMIFGNLTKRLLAVSFGSLCPSSVFGEERHITSLQVRISALPVSIHRTITTAKKQWCSAPLLGGGRTDCQRRMAPTARTVTSSCRFSGTNS